MSFLDKIKATFSRFAQGRNGADPLGMNLFISAMVLIIADSILQTGILGTLAIAIYVWALFRMHSRNLEKRRAENDRFVSMRNQSRTSIRQFFVRLKNSRKYKYFKCPQCKSRLRMPRGIGEKTVTCSKCRRTFTQKA